MLSTDLVVIFSRFKVPVIGESRKALCWVPVLGEISLGMRSPLSLLSGCRQEIRGS